MRAQSKAKADAAKIQKKLQAAIAADSNATIKSAESENSKQFDLNGKVVLSEVSDSQSANKFYDSLKRRKLERSPKPSIDISLGSSSSVSDLTPALPLSLNLLSDSKATLPEPCPPKTKKEFMRALLYWRIPFELAHTEMAILKSYKECKNNSVFDDSSSHSVVLESDTNSKLVDTLKRLGENGAKSTDAESSNLNDALATINKKKTSKKLKNPVSLHPHKIQFSQSSVSALFSDGSSVYNLFSQMKIGAILPFQVAPIKVMSILDQKKNFNGPGQRASSSEMLFSMDNRRLLAFKTLEEHLRKNRIIGAEPITDRLRLSDKFKMSIPCVVKRRDALSPQDQIRFDRRLAECEGATANPLLAPNLYRVEIRRGPERELWRKLGRSDHLIWEYKKRNLIKF